MNMLDLFKKLFFCWAFCACVSAVSGQDVPSSGAPEASDGLFNARRLAEFKRWVVNNANCDTITLLPAEKFTYEDVKDLLPNIVYVDTAAQTLSCALRLRVKPNGKILSCEVDGLAERIFVRRIKRAVARYPDNIFDSRALKASGASEVSIPISIPLPGHYIVVEEGLCRLAENEGMAGSWRIPQLRGPLAMAQHAYTVYCDFRSIGSRNSERTAGNIIFSFVIATLRPCGRSPLRQPHGLDPRAGGRTESPRPRHYVLRLQAGGVWLALLLDVVGGGAHDSPPDGDAKQMTRGGWRCGDAGFSRLCGMAGGGVGWGFAGVGAGMRSFRSEWIAQEARMGYVRECVSCVPRSCVMRANEGERGGGKGRGCEGE